MNNEPMRNALDDTMQEMIYRGEVVEDLREGVAAFVEKRWPQFKGR